MQIHVRPITFFWFDIGLPYLAHGCITMRRCVAYIHDPDTTMNFDLKVIINRVFDTFSSRAHDHFLIWHWLTIFGTWKMWHVHSCSGFDVVLCPQCQIYRVLSCLNVRIVICNFCLLWHWHTIFGTCIYHNEMMCQVHSWSWYDADLWPQGQNYKVYDMVLCSDINFLVLWHSHTLFGTRVYPQHC